MSKDLNLCQFIGRLGKDPEIRYTAGGDAVANFSIACGDDYKKKSGEKVEQTNWINVVAWGRLAEISGEYLKKGSQVYLSGKQVTRSWDDKEGNKRYTTEIVASEMQMLGGRGAPAGGDQGSNAGSPAPDRTQRPSAHPAPPTNQGNAGGFDNFDDDIPF